MELRPAMDRGRREPTRLSSRKKASTKLNGCRRGKFETDSAFVELLHCVENSFLKAHTLYKLDHQYVVQDGEAHLHC